jgi:hypothetical protein
MNTNRIFFSPLYLCISLTGKGNDGDNTRKLCLTHVFFRRRNSVPLDNDQYFLEETAAFFFIQGVCIRWGDDGVLKSTRTIGD